MTTQQELTFRTRARGICGEEGQIEYPQVGARVMTIDGPGTVGGIEDLPRCTFKRPGVLLDNLGEHVVRSSIGMRYYYPYEWIPIK